MAAFFHVGGHHTPVPPRRKAVMTARNRRLRPPVAPPADVPAVIATAPGASENPPQAPPRPPPPPKPSKNSQGTLNGLPLGGKWSGGPAAGDRRHESIGLMHWEAISGTDVGGSDLESIADKKMALAECFMGSGCRGVVWSAAQGQGYLKKSTANRRPHHESLKLTLYVPAYQRFDGYKLVSARGAASASSDSVPALKSQCEAMPDCTGFWVGPSSTTSPRDRAVQFYRGGRAIGPSDMAKGPEGSAIYRRASRGDLPEGTTAAGVVGNADGPVPVDISKDPPIIVGGTDGSGTRAVVTLFSNLNVLMVKDDACTFDVHGGEMGGWPPPVLLALKHTHGADYSPQDVPEPDRSKLRNMVKRFAAKMRAQARRFSRVQRHARWGFKAPIAQMLLPFLAEVFPGLSFVHVVRDGRDLPFSRNQSPVDKFFATMYSNDANALRMSQKTKAIRMWADANTQVHRYMSRVAAADPDPARRYLVVKIEMSVEEKSLLQMGKAANEALGLGYGRADMCCRLRGYIAHLRQKDFFKGVKTRYGKWRKLTEDDARLRQLLNEQGHHGLKMFGYLDKVLTPMYKVNAGEDVCAGVSDEEATDCEFHFPSKCIESPSISRG